MQPFLIKQKNLKGRIVAFTFRADQEETDLRRPDRKALHSQQQYHSLYESASDSDEPDVLPIGQLHL